MKLTCSKLRYFIADEKKAVQEYKKYGLPSLGKDEAKHRIFLMGKLKSCER
jgi:hypothetical protein